MEGEAVRVRAEAEIVVQKKNEEQTALAEVRAAEDKETK